LIARANKKKPTSSDSGRGESMPPQPTSKPISFEDLLREIQEAKAPKQPMSPVATVKPIVSGKPKKYDFEDYDDDLEEETKSLEQPSYDTHRDDVIYETYEKAKLAAFERPSLEETMKVENTEVKYGQFKEYGQVEKVSIASKIKRDLADKENFKKAFILSEVLNRKF
jgi:hypothetical protein